MSWEASMSCFCMLFQVVGRVTRMRQGGNFDWSIPKTPMASSYNMVKRPRNFNPWQNFPGPATSDRFVKICPNMKYVILVPHLTQWYTAHSLKFQIIIWGVWLSDQRIHKTRQDAHLIWNSHETDSQAWIFSPHDLILEHQVTGWSRCWYPYPTQLAPPLV